jgi:hypothetical protein
VARLRRKETKKTARGDKWFDRIENAINYCRMEKRSAAEQASCVIW